LFTANSANAVGGTNSASTRVGGASLEWQGIDEPAGANLMELQVSPDNVNWAVAEDNSGAAITAMGLVHRNVGSKSEYARLHIAQDAGGVRPYAAVLTIRKDVS